MIALGKINHLCFLLLISYVCTSSSTESTSTESTYDYTESNWPDTCKVGKRQSPVDVDSATAIVIKNNTIVSLLYNTYSPISGRHLQIYDYEKYGIDLAGQDTLLVQKNKIIYFYNLVGFHFHIASEHTVAGKQMDLEMHLVHAKNKTYLQQMGVVDPDKNDYLVVGIQFRASASADNNTVIQAMNFGSKANVTGLDLSQYVQPSKNFYHYQGSLTTPTCVESVNWVVMDTIETISQAQYDEITKWIKPLYPRGNARATKSLYGRSLYYIQNSNSTYLKSSLFGLLAIFLIFMS